jgi:hypothetical protein
MMTPSSSTPRPPSTSNHSRLRQIAVAIGLVILAIASESRLFAQSVNGVSAQAIEQINALIREKQARTAVQQKISSRLIYAAKMERGEAIADGVATLEINLPDRNARGVVVDVRAEVSDRLLANLQTLGAELLDVNVRYSNVRLRIGLQQVETIASLPEVTWVQPKQEAMTMRLEASTELPAKSAAGGPVRPDAVRAAVARKRIERASLIAAVQQSLEVGPFTNVGSKNSEGDLTHKANVARTTYGVSGAGVKVGVLSDGVGGLAASQALGDLGTVTVLTGQAGSGAEGTAMLEIVHDLAPNAQLYFATAFTSITSFADNIRALRAAGCDIIVDDVGYFVETPFQDGQTVASPTNGGVVIQAVKEVTAAGALYFSSAANSGNKNDNQSGTWEGDFVDGGAGAGPLLNAGQLHNFGGQNFNVITIANSSPITLFWSDPLGASGNDYDLYRLDSTGATVLETSNDTQDGNDDPFEGVNGGSASQRVVIAKYSGAARFLHLDTNRNRLQISTSGQTHGHAATTAPNSFGVAATPASTPFTGGTPGPYPNPFNAGNKVEPFSSDGFRRIFFTAAGAAITPGNVSATGGQLLLKPDLTAADGVSVTGSGGFPTTFYGTSASAPHAAAIAALVKSRNLALTAPVIRAALFSSAIDIEGAGVDRDSGIGIIMADRAVAAAAKHDGDFDGDGKADLTIFRPASASWYTLGSSSGYATYTSRTWGTSTDTPVAGDYDGDGKADNAIYRPSNGTWWILKSSSNFTTYVSYTWGGSGDVPVPGDYDGDGRTDVAIYRPSTGTWWVLKSSTNYVSYTSYSFGTNTDVPVARDFDGDGTTDIALFRPAAGVWYVLPSSTNFTVYTSYVWGTSSDVPVAADYDGDGQADFAVYRPSNGSWWVLKSSTNYSLYSSYQWGGASDVPVPADYDGDGKADVAIYRPASGTWWWLLSSTNSTTYVNYYFGSGSDVAVRP